MHWFYWALIAVVASAVLGTIIWACVTYIPEKKKKATPAVVTPAVVPTPVPARNYMVSAARGDAIHVMINPENTEMTYQNLTQAQATKTTASITVGADGHVTVHDSPDFSFGTVFQGDYILLAATTLGPAKNELGFALGLKPKLYTAPQFPTGFLNYMQFRANNGGFEVGIIDVKAQNDITHQHWDHTNGFGEPTTLPIGDVSTFALSEDKMSISFLEQKEQQTITIFQTESNNVVLDMDNGSIYAVQADTTTSVPAGTYKGIVYGKDNAVSLPENKGEEGTAKIMRFVLTVESDQKYVWSEENVEITRGTFEPLTAFTPVTTGIFHGVTTTTEQENVTRTSHVVVVMDKEQMLCGYYSKTDAMSNAYKYRHGAAQTQ